MYREVVKTDLKLDLMIQIITMILLMSTSVILRLLKW